MELFNKYKNKNFAYMTNYINNCINDDSLALTPEELHRQLSGSSQSSFEEFIQAILNTASVQNNYNASILYNNGKTMQPVRQISVPVRATIAEKAWLYYILQDSKSDLFINQELKERLITALSKNINLSDYPLQPEYIDIREFAPQNRMMISDNLILHFRTIVDAIKNHKYLTVTNNSYSGQVYLQQKVIPYKLEYSAQFDSFSLSCFPLEAKRPVKMNLKNISEVIIGEQVEAYEEFIINFEKQLSDAKAKQPVTIEIINQAEAYDRCTYLFSSFDTFCYDKGNEKLVMNIYYYRFQQEEIVRNILFMGHYVKVISPQALVDDVISAIKGSYDNYCQLNQAVTKS